MNLAEVNLHVTAIRKAAQQQEQAAAMYRRKRSLELPAQAFAVALSLAQAKTLSEAANSYEKLATQKS